MRTRFFALALLTAFTLFGGMTATGQVPRIFTWQGVLAGNNGNPMPDGNYRITVSLYSEAFGGAPLYTESQTVSINGGLFSTIIGGQEPIPASLRFDGQYFIGLSVENGPELQPRTPLTTVPYAMNSVRAQEATRAETAAGLEGGSVRSINGRDETITIVGEGGTTVTTSGSTITIRSDENGTGVSLGGDLAGTLPNPQVVKLQGRSVSAASPSTGQVLKYNGTTWAPAEDEGSLWNGIGDNVFLTGRNVGIGTSSPSEPLEVQGRIKATQLQMTSGAESGRLLVSDDLGRAGWTSRIRTKGSDVMVTNELGVGLPDTLSPDGPLHVMSSYSGFNPVATRTAIIENKGEVSLSMRTDSGRRARIYFERPVGQEGAFIQNDSTLVVIGKHRFTAINGTSQSYRFYFDNAGGRLGIGRYPEANKLEVNGSASKSTAGDWLANSDRRIKTEIRTVENGRETLMKIRPVTFRYTDEWMERHPEIEDRTYYNVIAQEYREVFPHAVKGSGEYLEGDGEEVLQVDTYDAQVVTMKAVQELIEENRELRKRIERLERINDMVDGQ